MRTTLQLSNQVPHLISLMRHNLVSKHVSKICPQQQQEAVEQQQAVEQQEAEVKR